MNGNLRRVEVRDGDDILRVAEEVRASRETVLLTRGGEDLAVVRPVPRRLRSAVRGKPLTEDDPLFGLIGIGRSGSTSSISENKYSEGRRVP